MKSARLMVLVIAVAAAGGAAMLAKNFIAAPKSKNVQRSDGQTVKVLVASSKIGLGDTIRASNVRWQDWPAAAAIGGYVTKKNMPQAVNKLSGSLARAPFLVGEPIKQQKIIKASDGGVMAAILPSGMRAISTPIREETAAGGFILPNDRVDVIVSRKVRGAERGQRERSISETVLKNVRVLAIGQNIEIKDGKKVANGKTATLELSPRQAELIALARTMGEISLSLRSLADVQSTAQGGPATADSSLQRLANGQGAPKQKQRLESPFGPNSSSQIKVLKYGVSSQVNNVN